MKLPELKKKFQNKFVVRVIAGVLVFAMVGTGMTTYEAVGGKLLPSTLTAQAATKDDKKTTDDTEESEDEEENGDEDTASSMDEIKDDLKNGLKINETEIGKEETVYVISDNTGKVTKTIVSDHLINKDDSESLEDASSLKEIKNVKGDEEFKQNGSKITWDAKGKDIYYQGTTEETLPVEQKITYFLDGKEIAPQELAGKSGKVTIRFDYTNNAKVNATVDGKDTEVCVPFAAISGMILDDSFSDIEVTNGKVIKDGANNVVVGYALPGLKESLDVDDSDFDGDVTIPDYFEVTAQVKDFSLGMTMTAVMNAANFVSSEESDGLDSVDELLDTLTDATSQLEEGSGALADGLDTLHESMGDFVDGVCALNTGIGDYTDGASQLADGIATLKASTPELSSGVNKLGTGITAIYDNFGTKDNQKTIRGGVNSISGGAGQISDGAKSLVDGAGQVAEGAKSAAAGASQLSDGANQAAGGANSVAAGAKDAAAGASRLSDGANQVAGGAADLATGAGTAATGAASLAQGTAELSTGAAQVRDGVSQLTGTIGSLQTNLVAQKQQILDQLNASGVTEDTLSATIDNLNASQAQLVEAYGNLKVEEGKGDPDAAAQAEQVKAQYDTVTASLSSLNKAAGSLAVINAILSSMPQDMADQMNALNAGATQVADGAASAAAGAGELATGTAALKNGADTLATGASSVAAGAGSLKEGTAKLSTGAAEVSDGVNQLAAGAGRLKEGTSQLSEGAGQVSGGAGSLMAGADALKTGAGTLQGGVEQLYSQAIAPVKDGMDSLIGSMPTLLNGVDALNAGAETLVSNNASLVDGALQIKDATGKIDDGVTELTDGAHQLADGVITFNEEGINELVNSYNGDAKPLLERLQAVIDAGNDYQTFTDLAKDVNGSVKFIYKTASVEAEDKEE